MRSQPARMLQARAERINVLKVADDSSFKHFYTIIIPLATKFDNLFMYVLSKIEF